jgi:hypothetical protein
LSDLTSHRRDDLAKRIAVIEAFLRDCDALGDDVCPVPKLVRTCRELLSALRTAEAAGMRRAAGLEGNSLRKTLPDFIKALKDRATATYDPLKPVDGLMMERAAEMLQHFLDAAAILAQSPGEK